MDRRRFLGMAAGSVAGAGAIGWLAHYFSRPAPDTDPGEAIASMGDVSAVYRRAFALGKPLLVLVIPENDQGKRDRGAVFGALLNHGGNNVYLDLSLCELVCASVVEIKRELPDLKVEGEPLMLLVETEGAKARATPIDPQIRYDIDNAWKEGAEKIDQLVRERLLTVAAALRAAVAPSREALLTRAALAESRLGPDETKALRAAAAADKPPEPIERGAAILRAVAEDPGAPKPKVLEALADAAKGRFTGGPPAGAKWANSGGCGVNIEGEEPVRVGCGMGRVPKLSERFLWFFTQ
jgi:hypothetical protein